MFTFARLMRVYLVATLALASVGAQDSLPRDEFDEVFSRAATSFCVEEHVTGAHGPRHSQQHRNRG